MTRTAAALVASDGGNETNNVKPKRRRINKSVLHRRIDLIERSLNVFGSDVREQLLALRRDTFYDASRRPGTEEAAAKAKKRRGHRGGQRVQRSKRGGVAAVAASAERGVVASGDAKDGHDTTQTNPSPNPATQRKDPNPKTNPESVVAGVEWTHPREMKLGQRRRLKTEKTGERKTAEEQKQVGWRRRLKAVEWRACKAEDEVKQLRRANEEMKKAVAAGGQVEVVDPTLKGAAPEVINFCLQSDVEAQKGQLRELRVQHKELQAKTEQLQQRLTQEGVFLAAARERVQKAEQRLTAVQASDQQKLQQQQEQIAQLGHQLKMQMTTPQPCELQSRVPIVYGNVGAGTMSAQPSPPMKKTKAPPAAPKIKKKWAEPKIKEKTVIVRVGGKQRTQVRVWVDGNNWVDKPLAGEVQETVFHD